MVSGLQWTGERFLPDVEGDVQLEHLHRYYLASRLAHGKKVLDIACGEGYGSNILADVALSVTGIDISEEAILCAQNKYNKENLNYIQGECTQIPLPDHSVDLIVSFETIEHHDRHLEFILEIKRVLKKEGLLIISSPDKKEYSDLTGHDNQFHVKELYYPEFERLIKGKFKHHVMLGQRIKYGSYITPLNTKKKNNFIGFKKSSNGIAEEKTSIFNPLYFISIASEVQIPQAFLSLYEHPLEDSEFANKISNALSIKKKEYDHLSNEHDALFDKHGALSTEYDALAEECYRTRAERDSVITEQALLKIDLARKNAMIDDILNSTSWYVTNPIRWFRRKMTQISDSKMLCRIKSVKNMSGFPVVQNFHNAVQTAGGIKKIPSKALYLYKNKKGFKNTIKYLLSKIQKQAPILEVNLPMTADDQIPHFEHCFSLNNNKDMFITYKSYPEIDTDIRVIAFYLPQFHPIKENDEAWGKGFTEWTNVTKAIPQFAGHYQPKLPGELGFYDLRLGKIQKRQIELAKNYGIHGFCYHYYWFNGQKVLNTPLEQILSNPELDFPFCINWANENWTKRWDGLENEVILKQNHSFEDDMAFIKEIESILKDHRYIRVNGKPLLMIYRPSLFPEIKETVRRWREYCRECGIGEIYLVLSHAHEHTDPNTIDFDAATEFAPNTFQVPDISGYLHFYNKNHQGHVFDYNSAIDYSISRPETAYVKFRSLCPGWDNEARKPGKGISFHNSSPERYSLWLEYLLYNTQKQRKGDEKIIFLNAWNEWAEGAYLEPDSRYGYAYLDQTRNTLKKFDKEKHDLLRQCRNIQKTAEIAVIIHLYYIELWDEVKANLASFKEVTFDLYININNECSVDHINTIRDSYPDARIFSFENRGRDILPFLKIFNIVYPLNYGHICKIHSKKSFHREDGDKWRHNLINGLIGSPAIIKENLEKFVRNPKTGIIVPKGNVFEYKDWIGSNNEMVEGFALKNNIKITEDFTFPSGSMFWFKPVVFKQLYKNIDFTVFKTENGQLDGTMAHSIERIFGLLCHANGYDLVE